MGLGAWGREQEVKIDERGLSQLSILFINTNNFQLDKKLTDLSIVSRQITRFQKSLK